MRAPLTSIRQKLRLVIMLTSAVALALTASAFIAYELITYRQTLMEYVRTVGTIVGANSTAALLFRNNEDAAETLSNLRLERYIVAGSIYDESGSLFAVWPTNSAAFPKSPELDGYTFNTAEMLVFQPISQSGSRVGTLFMRVDLGPMHARFRLYALIVAAVLLTSLLVAYFMANSFMNRISLPITTLAETAKHVSQKHDYTVRAARLSNDELGVLTDGFNHMLTQIHTQDIALRESEERLRLALEASGTGTWNLNFQDNAISGDTYMKPLFGLDRGAFKGSVDELTQHIHPDDRTGFTKLLKGAIDARKDFSAQFRVVRPDGTIRHLASRGRAFYGDDGKPLRMTGVVLDITDAQEAAQALRESEERFRSMADAAPVLIWVGSGETERSYFNRPWLEFTGRSLESQMGADWIEGVHVDDRDRVLELQTAGGKAHEPFTTEYRLRRKDGVYRWVIDTGVPRCTAEGKFVGFIGSCIDITERKAAESELEERVHARTFELAETNQELESFTYSVSHDLRAPLRHIDGYAQILQEDYLNELSPEAVNYVNRIRSGTKKMGQLVDDLLNLARVGRIGLNTTQVDLNAIVAELVEELQGDAGQRKIDWQIADLPTVQGDAGLVKQVFTNLLSNAFKYSRQRPVARIEVGATRDPGAEPVFFVRDNGVGFNMKYSHKLFGVFQRLHRPEEFEGTGVGLATVDRIIRKHGGRIWAEAELDKGAAFYFTLAGTVDKNPQGSAVSA